MINYKKAGFDNLKSMFDTMLDLQAKEDHKGFVKLCSLLNKEQKIGFIDYGKTHHVFAGAMKDMVCESMGGFTVAQAYMDTVSLELNKYGYMITNSEGGSYPEISFTDNQFIEGTVSLYDKKIKMKAVDADEKIYEKSITFNNIDDMLESINHFQNDIIETFRAKAVPDCSMDSMLQDEDFMKSIDAEAIMPKKEAEAEDTIAVNELTLYAENDGQLYYQRIQPIIKNYARKMLRNVYDETLAIKGFMYVVNDALKKYNAELGELRLTKEEKEEVAKNLLDHYMAEIKDTVDQISIGRVEKESNEDEELDKKIAAISGDSLEALVLSKFLKEDPKNVSTMDGENYSVKNKTEVFKVSERPLDIKEQGYKEDSFMEDGKEYFIYWK